QVSVGLSTTRVPTARSLRAPGLDATSPATSVPRMWGSRCSRRPRRTQMSRRLSAQARTRTRISPGAGLGSGHSRSSMTSGPPCRSITAALIAVPLPPPPHLPVPDRHRRPQAPGPREVLPVGVLEVEATLLELEDGDVGGGARPERAELAGAADRRRRRGGRRADHGLERPAPTQE